MLKSFWKIENLNLFVICLLIFGVFYAPGAHGFIGPGTQSPGSGGGSFYIDSNRNIGFGVSSATPVSTFDDNSQGFGYVFAIASSTNPGVALKNLNSGNTYIWSSRNFGNFQLYRESASLPGKVLMDIKPTGEIGINVFNPTERLDVGGNIRANAFVGTVSGAVVAGNVSSDVFGSLQGGGSFAFPASLGVATSSKTGLPQNLSVYGGAYVAGSLGIGTTSPNRKLEVGGNVAIRTSGEAGTESRGIEITPTTWDTGTHTIRSWSAGNGLLLDSANTGTANAGSEIQLYAASGSSGDIVFRGTNYGTAMQDRAIIKGDTGNVGIGTTSPAKEMHIYRASPTQPALRIQRDAQTIIDVIANSDAGAVYTLNNYALWFGTNSATRIYISTDGNVGIATTTPTTARLVVSPASGISLDALSGKIINVGTPTLPGDATTKSYVDSVVASGGGGWTKSGGTVYTSVLTDSVGIGTTGPSKKLDVVGDVKLGNSGGDGYGRIFLNQKVPRTYPTVIMVGADDDLGTNELNFGGGTSIGYITKKIQFHTSANDTTTGNSVRMTIGSAGQVTIAQNLVVQGAGDTTIAGNVGVGSTSPAYKLDVTGTGQFTQPVIVGTPTGNSHAATKNYVDSVLTGGASDGSFNTLAVSGTSTLATTGGRVGIGTTIPQATLQIGTDTGGTAALKVGTNIIAGSSIRAQTIVYADQAFSITGALAMRATGTSGILTLLNNAETGWTRLNLGGTTSSFPALAVNGSDLQIIRADGSTNANLLITGNVGIGTTAPIQKLQVIVSNAVSPAINDAVQGQISGAPTWDTYGLRGLNYTTGTGTAYGVLGSATGAGTKNIGAYFTASGATTNYGLIVNSGNVGIGSTSPEYKLDVTGTGQFTQPVIVGTPTNTTHATTKSYVDSMFTGSGQWTTSGSNAYFSLAGNVGIGTTAPTNSRLYVSPGTRNTVFNASNVATWADATLWNISDTLNTATGIRFVSHSSDASDAGAGIVGIKSAGSTNQYDLAFITDPAGTSAVERMRILSSGNVGIGTTAPSQLLTLSNATRPTLLMIAPGSGNYALGLDNNGYFRITYGTAVTDASHFTMTSTGNVGIGTTAPTELLTLNKASGKVGIRLEGNGTNVAEFYVSNAGANHDTVFGTVANNPLYIQTSGSTRMTIASNAYSGNVGINTTQPAYKLDVTGTGQFTQPVIVGTPTNTTHATTKSYVDSAVLSAGGTKYKRGEKTASISTVWATVLSVALSADHRSASAKIYVGGRDWGCHSAPSLNIQAMLIDGNGAYGQPGVINRASFKGYQDDYYEAQLTWTDPDTANVQVRAVDGNGDGFSCGSGAYTQDVVYEVMGNFSSVN